MKRVKYIECSVIPTIYTVSQNRPVLRFIVDRVSRRFICIYVYILKIEREISRSRFIAHKRPVWSR